MTVVELTTNEKKVVILKMQKMLYTLFDQLLKYRIFLSIKFSQLHSSFLISSSTLSLSFSSSLSSDLFATVSGASQPLSSSYFSSKWWGNSSFFNQEGRKMSHSKDLNVMYALSISKLQRAMALKGPFLEIRGQKYYFNDQSHASSLFIWRRNYSTN